MSEETKVLSFTIDSGIDIPDDFRVSQRKYPFEEMEVGDSFFLPPEYEDDSPKRLSGRVAQARQAYQKRCAKQGMEKRFTQRQYTQDGIFGVRVWRVE